MRTILMLTALVAIAAVATASPVTRTVIPIVQYDEKRDDFNQFAFSYLTGDGTKVTEQGALKPTRNGQDRVLVLSGSHSYTAPDGRVIELTFTADENGYHPVGDHIPKLP